MTANHIARMTAKRLIPKFGDALPLTVEQVIQSDAGTTRPICRLRHAGGHCRARLCNARNWRSI